MRLPWSPAIQIGRRTSTPIGVRPASSREAAAFQTMYDRHRRESRWWRRLIRKVTS